jgi:hypothetical protein
MKTDEYETTPLTSVPAPEEATKRTIDHGISATELVAFAGGEHYPRVMSQLLNGTSRHAGFNTWAALFGIQWFFFRKLYLFGIFSAALEVAIPLIFVWVLKLSFAINNRVLILLLGAAMFIFSRIVIGYVANIALCLKASKVIREVDSLNKDNETHLRLIKHAGGVSMPSLFGIYAILGVIRIATSN